ncbi:glycosyltransferase involved in cell wall biosynthesis [Pedobacter sp. UYP30]|uniref:glycosyltransferase family 4 protein n=1 Tax=Pedobacter sp. UYP30 TaxID=1756400 RepID=UPI00339135F1
MKKLAVVITHPIQYYVPVFQLLAKACDLKVFYTWGDKGTKEKYDPAFKKLIHWDLPLLDGYNYQLLQNTAKNPGSHRYKGIDNPDLIQQINTFKPDVILVYGWAYQSHLKVLRYFKGKIPIWFRGDSNLIDEKTGIKQLIRSLFLKWVYSHVDKAFYVGKANKAYYQKFGMPTNQLIFAPHAIDNDRFAEDKAREAEELRTTLNIKKEDILILFAGKFEKKKNPELLLNAFIRIMKESEVGSPKSEVKSVKSTIQSLSYEGMKNNAVGDKTSYPLGVVRRIGVHLLFVGNGELEKSLKKKAGLEVRGYGLKDNEVLRQLVPISREAQDDKGIESRSLRVEGLSSITSLAVVQADRIENKNPHLTSHISRLTSQNIHFMDFQNQMQMPIIYQACDLFCLPSKGPAETWGLTINEAMAAGKAILISDKVGCGFDLVNNDENGYSFESGNEADLIDKLKKLCADKDLLRNMGKISLAKIASWNFKAQVQCFRTELDKI